MNLNTLSQLKAVLANNAELQPLDDQAAADAINATTTTLVSKSVDARTLGMIFGAPLAVSLLETLKGLASSNEPTAPLFKYILDLLSPEAGGIDIGLQQSQDMLDQWAVDGLITVEVAAALKAVGQQKHSIAIDQVGETVITADVVLARASNAADALAQQLTNDIEQGLYRIRESLATYMTAVANGETPTAPTLDTLKALI